MSKGFIKIPRKIFSSDMWNEKRVFSRYEALTDLYQTADYNSRSLTVSFRTLADRWRWCLAKVQRFIKSLSDEGYISVSKCDGVTVFTICDTPSDTPNDTPNDTPKSPSTKDLRGVGDTPNDTPSDTPTDTLSHAYKNDNIISCLNEELKEDITPLYSPKGETKYDWSIVSEDFRPIVEQWLVYKKEKKQTYKSSGFKTFCKRLIELSNGNKETARLIVEQSMANNYSGIFELKTNYGNSRPNYQNNGHPSDDQMVGIALDVIEEFKAKRRNGG